MNVGTLLFILAKCCVFRSDRYGVASKDPKPKYGTHWLLFWGRRFVVKGAAIAL